MNEIYQQSLKVILFVAIHLAHPQPRLDAFPVIERWPDVEEEGNVTGSSGVKVNDVGDLFPTAGDEPAMRVERSLVSSRIVGRKDIRFIQLKKHTRLSQPAKKKGISKRPTPKAPDSSNFSVSTPPAYP